VAAELGKDGALGFGRRRLQNGEVVLACLAIGELAHERLLGAVCLGRDDATGGVLVETMDDAGAFDATDAGELSLAMMEEGVDQGPVRIPGRGMHDEAGRLVGDDEVRVFVDDFEGDVLGENFAGFRGRDFDADFVAFGDRRFGADGLSVELDVPGLDEGLNTRTRQFTELFAQEDIKAFARMVGDRNLHRGESRGIGEGVKYGGKKNLNGLVGGGVSRL